MNNKPTADEVRNQFLEWYEGSGILEGDTGAYLAAKIGFHAGISALLAEPVAWRCFHCDESFSTNEAAAEHFGKSALQNPACQINIAEYREMEARMLRYNAEDADCHRAMYRMESAHQVTLRRAEEAGYAKALKDTNYAEPSPVVAPQGVVDEGLLAAAKFASDVLAELYAKYQLKIGPYASQAQRANVKLRAAIKAAPSPAEGSV